MAERDKAGEDAGAAAAGAVEEKPKGKSRFLLILIPLILLGISGGGWIAYSQYAMLARIGHSDEAAEEAAGEPVEYGEFMEMEPLIINPAGTDGTRYLMVKIGVESDQPSALEEITTKQVVVRDAIVEVLSARTVETLSDIGLRETIKQDLRTTINEILESGKVTRLYFTQYVLQ